ncbi:MAG: single-stranded DNA-binding protein [Thermoleophilaceae bacterium]|nr:single-stranded DNA-binding protein [Thermoleophilaceae bacterium]
MNHVSISGNLTADPVKKPTKSDKLMATASIAINHPKSGEVEYFDITAFDKTAEILLDRGEIGRPVAISGRLRYRAWEDEGKKRSAVDIVANQVFIAEKRPRKQDASETRDQSEAEASQEEKVAVEF